MIDIRTCALVAIVALCALPAVAAGTAPAAAKEPGDLWEVTTQMSMEGMPMAMPSHTQKTCAPRDWKEPPMAKDPQHDCQTIDFKTTGSKTSWKVRCAGPPEMTGEGEITRSSPEAYTGVMKITSPQGVMTMKMNGRRVGDCDAAEAKQERAEMQAQIQAQAEKGQRDSAAALAEVCKSAVTSMSLEMLNMQAEMCKDPALKQAFCARLETQEGFELVAACGNNHGNGIDDEAAYCGKNPEEIAKRVCAAAAKDEPLDFLSRCCPGEAQAIAQRECAGRDYTALAGTKYAGFCVSYARKEMAGSTQEKEAAKTESKTEKAKKALKGLFKH